MKGGDRSVGGRGTNDEKGQTYQPNEISIESAKAIVMNVWSRGHAILSVLSCSVLVLFWAGNLIGLWCMTAGFLFMNMDCAQHSLLLPPPPISRRNFSGQLINYSHHINADDYFVIRFSIRINFFADCRLIYQCCDQQLSQVHAAHMTKRIFLSIVLEILQYSSSIFHSHLDSKEIIGLCKSLLESRRFFTQFNWCSKIYQSHWMRMMEIRCTPLSVGNIGTFRFAISQFL